MLRSILEAVSLSLARTPPAFFESFNLHVKRTLIQNGYGVSRFINYKYVVNVGRVANDDRLTVELTADLETNWPVVFQLQP